jgi:hypothetical protein
MVRGVPVNATFNAVLLTESANAAALIESVVGEGVTTGLEAGALGGMGTLGGTGTEPGRGTAAGSEDVTGAEAGVVGFAPCAGV